ncbi:hypothetical protein [Phaeobacter gallaeciensis]|uniref:Uncharacterized protein n=1 Tax=Phaeobacter gallaeciensis TaxID=60890 RepID=A0AAD0ECY8_9RHOB|nr:hypothetical protein [Phaeobacter gallaeciensis]AHD09503.1 hypothetical protein Gal_01747 [Phaeobacter gallaeciensis DSM 26640]ATE92766.1 hypothetical protein PhaeoP11_01738 [Phaeobacter gallaeciensis]ATE92768.1 hypothetical protein PhaeoP11_01740 [Phaeobacter gallaeciensis]ATE97410.1 hypothetical protein PhaeoP73_02106 [Phaeobacter gallaeciensis]ATE97412.1 hypothetical protein PhaeoP73_02108 [Phaeobacter gallaeciensis]
MHITSTQQVEVAPEVDMITTTVFNVETRGYNWIKNAYNKHLVETSEQITAGLAKRLVRFAQRQIEESGFSALVDDKIRWSVETTDAHLKPSDRIYHVTLHRPEGGELILNGIMTDHGHPFLHHGFSVEI